MLTDKADKMTSSNKQLNSFVHHNLSGNANGTQCFSITDSTAFPELLLKVIYCIQGNYYLKNHLLYFNFNSFKKYFVFRKWIGNFQLDDLHCNSSL